MQDGIAMQFRRRVLYYKSPLDKLKEKIIDRDLLSLGEPDDDTIYGPGNVMVVWVAFLLHRLPFVDDTRWRLILTEAYGYLSVAGDVIAQAVNPLFTGEAFSGGEMPQSIRTYQMAFVDGRYVTWESIAMDGFLDLETGDHVEKLAHPGLESLSYNLTELARRELRRHLVIEQRESTDASADHPT